MLMDKNLQNTIGGWQHMQRSKGQEKQEERTRQEGLQVTEGS